MWKAFFYKTIHNKDGLYEIRHVYNWSLALAPDTRLLKPLKILSDESTKSIFCSNEGTLERHLEGSWMGDGHQKDQAMI